MQGLDDQHEAGSVWRSGPKRTGFWARTGVSAETIYWTIFALGLAVLVLLIMDILGSPGA